MLLGSLRDIFVLRSFHVLRHERFARNDLILNFSAIFNFCVKKEKFENKFEGRSFYNKVFFLPVSKEII